MKITRVRLQQLEGYLEVPDGVLWEERLVRPIDVYPEHRAEGAHYTPTTPDGKYRVESVFLHVDTDEGVSGFSGPITAEQAFVVERGLKPILIGEDPRATERIWDKLYRLSVHGRKGQTMMAISAVDCALWDLKGKWVGAPVYRLLGGAVRTAIPAYASALGYSLETEKVKARARQLVEQGYRATKWFFRNGPADGREGMRRNVELVQALREAVGPGVDVMLDCWMSWDVPYGVAMAERLEEFRPRWLEEPVLPDKIESCAELRSKISIPVATGEHEYTRWGLKQLMDAGAADVLQPDIYWAGGISEVAKICNIASTYDLPVIPHGHSVPATAHLIASQPANVCPLLEYLIKWNEVHQFFFKNPVKPQGGVLTLPEGPGMGVEIDESRIVSQKELSWG